jgi:hypothetical protein
MSKKIVHKVGALDFDALVKKTKLGIISKSEILEVVRLGIANNHHYDVVIILGNSGLVEAIPLLEEIAISSEDLDASAKSLGYLLLNFKLKQWLPILIENATGSKRDFGDSLKLGAILTAGAILSQNRETEVLAAVLLAFEKSENPVVQSSAYDAMLLATGVDRVELPKYQEEVSKMGFDRGIVERVKKALNHLN